LLFSQLIPLAHAHGRLLDLPLQELCYSRQPVTLLARLRLLWLSQIMSSLLELQQLARLEPSDDLVFCSFDLQLLLPKASLQNLQQPLLCPGTLHCLLFPLIQLVAVSFMPASARQSHPSHPEDPLTLFAISQELPLPSPSSLLPALTGLSPVAQLPRHN